MTNQELHDLIVKRLAKLNPSSLELIDESHKHVGHPGSKMGGKHIALHINSSEFDNKKLIDSHRMIYDALGDLIGKEIHALKIKIVK